MKTLLAAALLLTISCASSGTGDVAPAAQPAADARLGELQTAMTELLERLDVLNDRIARLESAPPAAPAATAEPQAAPRVTTERQTLADAAPAGRPLTTPPQPPVTAASAPAEPQRAVIGAQIAESYRNAIVLYGKNRVSDSRRAFQDVFDADPTGELADNALFWIGETYFAAGDFNNAMRYYRRVIVEFADQNKAPDAMFKTALALERTGDLALAKQTLQQVIEKYPYSTPAASAKHELARIRF